MSVAQFKKMFYTCTGFISTNLKIKYKRYVNRKEKGCDQL